MGYDFHITRATAWTESEANPITMEEWLAHVESDPEMRLDGYAEGAVRDTDVVLRTEDPSMAMWTAYSEDGVDGNHAWMWHYDGRIMAKNADQEIRAKMWRIAQQLDARLVGDDDEEYGADGEPLRPIQRVDAPKRGVKKPWWKRWLGG